VKKIDAERTGQPTAFTTDSIWAADNLDGVNKESITSYYKPTQEIRLYNSSC
jgi:hypothetical protein